MKLSVVIATYRRRKSLLCLLEMLKSAYSSGELPAGSEAIVVEQAPFDFTEDEIRQAKKTNPLLRWLRTEKSGLPLSRNIGVLASGGEIIVFLDDDAEIGGGFFGAYLDFFSRAREKTAAASGPVNEPGRAMPSGLTAWLPLFISPLTGSVCGGTDPKEEKEIRLLRGGNMAFRRRALLEIGGFDLTLEKVALREETDAGERLKKLGYSIFFVPKAAIVHRRAPTGGERMEGRIELLYWGRRSESIFVTRNLSRLIWLGFYLRGLTASVLGGKCEPDLRSCLKAANAGMLDGRRAALASPGRNFLAGTAETASWKEI